MNVLTPEVRAELLAGYKERSLARVRQEDSLKAAVGQVADDWFMMAIGMKGFFREPLRVQWRVFRELINHNTRPLREHFMHTLASNMHVDANNNIAVETGYAHEIENEIPQLLGVDDLKASLGIPRNITRGAIVFLAANLDLVGINPNFHMKQVTELGRTILDSREKVNRRLDTSDPVIRLRHVVPAVAEWYDGAEMNRFLK